MNAKAFLLSTVSAFAFVPFASAAADLPQDPATHAEAIDYVQSCGEGHAGYFKLPGMETCVKIGGRFRGTISTPNLMSDADANVLEHMGYKAQARFNLESHTHFDFGSIDTYAAWYYDYDHKDSTEVGWDVGDVYTDINFNLGTITLGYAASQFDEFTGYSAIGSIGVSASDASTLQAAFTGNLGEGMFATLGVESSSHRGGLEYGADVIGKVGIAQGWGSFTLAGAFHQVGEGTADTTGFGRAGFGGSGFGAGQPSAFKPKKKEPQNPLRPAWPGGERKPGERPITAPDGVAGFFPPLPGGWPGDSPEKHEPLPAGDPSHPIAGQPGWPGDSPVAKNPSLPGADPTHPIGGTPGFPPLLVDGAPIGGPDAVAGFPPLPGGEEPDHPIGGEPAHPIGGQPGFPPLPGGEPDAPGSDPFEAETFGFAFGATSTSNITESTQFTIQGQYAQSALSYIGLTDDMLLGPDGLTGANQKGAHGWAVSAGIEQGLGEKVTVALDGSYQQASLDFQGVEYGAQVYGVNGSIAYEPVTNLILSLDAGWRNITQEHNSDIDSSTSETDEAIVSTRFQYSF